MPQPENAPESRVLAELRDCFEERFNRHNAELNAWQEKHVPKEQLPEWVPNALERFSAPYFQWLEGMDEAAPTLENFGKVVGALKFATENALNIAPLLAWHKRLGKGGEAKKMLRPLRELIVGIRRTIRSFLHKVQEFPANETTSFYDGYNLALRHNLVDEKGKTVIKNDATILYFFLVIFWKGVEQQKSFEQLHAWLRKFFPRAVLGDIDRLKGVCKRIKLRLGKRGRPKTQKK
jgi:hypothetical protein